MLHFKSYAKRVCSNKDVWVISCFFALACLLTWPFIIKPTTTITAAPYGDVSNSITKYNNMKRDHLKPFSSDTMTSVFAPSGVSIGVGVDRVSFLSSGFLFLFTFLFSSLIANSIFTFLGYFVSSTVIYFFIKSVLKSRRGAFYAGLVSTIFPLFVSLAHAAPVYIHLWIYVLPIWAFISLQSKFSLRSASLAALSILPGIFWTPYFMLHIFTIGFASLVAVFALHITRLSLKKLLVLAAIGVSWFAFAGLYYVVGMSTKTTGIPVRTLQEAYEQSSHPLMYLLPSSVTWWGTAGYERLVEIVPRAHETALYLGLSVIIIAILGVIIAFRSQDRRYRLLAYFGVVISVTGFLFSLAPMVHIFGITIITPNYVVTHFVPALRAAQRFAPVIELGLAMCGSIFIAHLFSKVTWKSMPYKEICFILILGVVSLDLSTKFLQLTAQIPNSPAVSSIRDKPDGLVAVYIGGLLNGRPAQIACGLQLLHEKPTINWCGMDTKIPLPLVFQVANLPLPEQAIALKKGNVRYVILDESSKEIIPSKIHLVENGYRRIASDPNYAVYGF